MWSCEDQQNYHIVGAPQHVEERGDIDCDTTVDTRVEHSSGGVMNTGVSALEELGPKVMYCS